MPKPSVYVETSVISYLAAPPSRDLIVAGHQQLTYEWRAEHRRSFDLFVSRVVLEEAGLGDPEMARRRLEVMEAIPRRSQRSWSVEAGSPGRQVRMRCTSP